MIQPSKTTFIFYRKIQQKNTQDSDPEICIPFAQSPSLVNDAVGLKQKI